MPNMFYETLWNTDHNTIFYSVVDDEGDYTIDHGTIVVQKDMDPTYLLKRGIERNIYPSGSYLMEEKRL